MNDVLEQQLVDFKTESLNDHITKFLEEYGLTQTPIEVSFRALLPTLKNIDRYTHLIHTYPAKLLLHIPYFFLNNEIFSRPGDLILDPFCGTGTVLLESLLAGRNSIGADANPLARLIAKVKVHCHSVEAIKTALPDIINAKNDRAGDIYPDVVNIDYWFNDISKSRLNQLRWAIDKLADDDLRDFFLVCFSNLIKKVSYADPRVSVPVRLNANRYGQDTAAFRQAEKRLNDLSDVDVFEKFQYIVNENLERVTKLNSFRKDCTADRRSDIISTDARNITTAIEATTKLADETVDLVITSPPYAGAQKYIRSSSLSLGWLSLASVSELKKLDKQTIGRESFSSANKTIQITGIKAADDLIESIKAKNIVRAHIVSNYLIEMQVAFIEAIRVLKTNGYFILIIGNNKVCDFEFNTQQYFSDFIESQGLTLVLKLIDDIKSYGLMTKRNKTADIISREWVLVFKK